VLHKERHPSTFICLSCLIRQSLTNTHAHPRSHPSPTDDGPCGTGQVSSPSQGALSRSCISLAQSCVACYDAGRGAVTTISKSLWKMRHLQVRTDGAVELSVQRWTCRNLPAVAARQFPCAYCARSGGLMMRCRFGGRQRSHFLLFVTTFFIYVFGS
jgi:hypothetical protein